MDKLNDLENYQQLVKSTPEILLDIFDKFEDSEWLLIMFMVKNGRWQAPSTPPPPNYYLTGSIEESLFLFWLNNPGYISNSEVRLAMEIIILILVAVGINLPATNITASQYQRLIDDTLIYDDGSFIATSQYALYDQSWMIALHNFIKTIEYSAFYGGILPIPALPYSPIVIPPKSGQIVVGLLADWGAGGELSKATLNCFANTTPDCVIHLGDVYYSGTPYDDEGYDYSSLGEEVNNFLNIWPQAWHGTSFTLNSNHEMYCGANGLFNDILLPLDSAFHSQGGYTVFALKIADWTILGLDSAYNADVSSLFMNGSLDPQQGNLPKNYVSQTQWIRSLGLTAAKTIVLTHHNAFDYNCDPQQQSVYTNFWGQVSESLGGDPYAWYWGHVHNGIVYTTPVVIPASINSAEFETYTYCRCLGHGSLPYGTSSLLAGNETNIDWFAGKGGGDVQLPNGAVTLVFEIVGAQVSKITENFWFSNAPEQAAYSQAIYP